MKRVNSLLTQSILVGGVVPFSLLMGGCGATAPESDSTPVAQTSASIVKSARPAAKEFVALNAEADANLHLVARVFVNEDTEVLSLYEPHPGHIWVVSAGRPKNDGPAMLAQHKGKTAEEWWRAVAPQERIPTALLDAMARQAAGIGNEQLVSLPASAPPSAATMRAADAAVATPKVLGTGYCDTQWPSDFPDNLMGSRTSISAGGPYVKYESWGSWMAPVGSWAVPYGNGCDCSPRQVQGLRYMDHPNNVSVTARNEWENYVNVCPSYIDATLVVTASNGKGTWNIPEDNYLAVEDTGTVSCFITSCTSTNDIGSFQATAYTNNYLVTGYLNYFIEAYGP